MRRWRAWRLVSAVFLLLALGAALPGPGDKPADTPPAAAAGPPAGDLLVASAQITDPRFSHAVILILKHDAGGAFGIVINRPLEEKSIASLLSAAKDAKPGHRGDDSGVEGTIRVFAGGPVRRALGFIVHTPDYRREATMAAGPLVSMTPTTEALRDIGHRKGPAKYFFALGYAGWGPGQLEAEIGHRDWFATPGDEALIFDDDRGELWKHALERRAHDL